MGSRPLAHTWHIRSRVERKVFFRGIFCFLTFSGERQLIKFKRCRPRRIYRKDQLEILVNICIDTLTVRLSCLLSLLIWTADVEKQTENSSFCSIISIEDSIPGLTLLPHKYHIYIVAQCWKSPENVSSFEWLFCSKLWIFALKIARFQPVFEAKMRLFGNFSRLCPEWEKRKR